MKDNRLEEQFNGYFDGIDTPDISITEDAKKFVTKPSRLPRIAKIASIAASFVVCVTTAVIVTLNVLPEADNTVPPSSLEPDGTTPSNPGASAPDEPGSSGSSGEISAGLYYGDGELITRGVNAYTASAVDKSLKFIEKLSFSANANVTLDRSDFENGTLALVRAEAVVVRQSRYDAEIFVEYTDRVYSPLKDYADGQTGNYKGMKYVLTRETADNGEPVNKLLVEKNGVKYYFNVQSSDYESYRLCLELLSD